MTTEEKLIALGFSTLFNESDFYKDIRFYNVDLRFCFCTISKKGWVLNQKNEKTLSINNFTELLKCNDFYEKQAKRIARRNEGRDGSETQNQFHQAH